MKVKGKDLIFISTMAYSGLSIYKFDKQPTSESEIYNTEFKLRRLSLTHDTFITSSMSTYVVKLKSKVQGCPFDEKLNNTSHADK